MTQQNTVSARPQPVPGTPRSAVGETPKRSGGVLRAHFIARATGMVPCFLVVGSALAHRSVPAPWWGGLAFHTFVWPYASYVWAKSSETPNRRLRAMMYVDAFFAGHYAPLHGFQLWPTFAVLAANSLSNLNTGGLSLELVALAWSALGAGLTALAYHPSFTPDSSIATSLLSMAFVFAYLGIVSSSANRVMTELRKTKLTVEAQNRQITGFAGELKETVEEQTRELRLANEKLARADQLKDEFLANTSHELRTPLHGMLGLTEAVLQSSTGLDSAARERLGMVVASGRRLSSLVNDILDFSKLRHQAVALREKNQDLHDAVALALSVISPMASAKGLSLRSEVALETLVRADENRVQQILTNLLGNAVKFTARGEVVVRADVHDSRVFVSVRDTGLGIPLDAQVRIFESFEQADGSTSREYGGTGLGLAVTKQLVELHGGKVTVISTPGEGSTFTFDLARADREADSTARAPADSAAADSVILRSASPFVLGEPEPISTSSGLMSVGKALAAGSAGHVLVADDDPVNIEVLRAQLEPAGYSVTSARDGAEAVAALESLEHVDGVLLDVMMPKMTGVQAAERIRELHPHGTLPILMLTAKSRPEDVVVGMRAGASDYIGKPFHREELLQRVDAHVQSVKTARAFRRFVPEDFLGLLGVERFDALRAGIGQRREMTILFTDVRNFTTRSELLGPEAIFRFINGCLERFEPVVRRHGGFVDKFIGDAVMAIFPGDPLDAARAAEGLHREVALFNAARPDAPMPLAIGVGVHRGSVILGTVGGADRMEVTAIGDAVNVAARLESLTKGLGAGAVVSEEVLRGKTQDARRIGAVHVKGRSAPVELFELLSCCSTESERQQKAATSDGFQRGLRAYAQGDMTRARDHFASCVSEAPLDRVASLYLERSVAYAERGLATDFDGCLDGI